MYTGTCLNRPAMGPATYGLFIQVVSLSRWSVYASGRLDKFHCIYMYIYQNTIHIAYGVWRCQMVPSTY